MAVPEARGRHREWRLGTHQSSTGSEGQPRISSLRRIFPYLRSMSEPGTGGRSVRLEFQRVKSDTERRALSVSSLITSFSRRFGRVLKDESEPGESGRNEHVHGHVDSGDSTGKYSVPRVLQNSTGFSVLH